MKEKIARLFTCANLIVDGVPVEELVKTFDGEEIRYSKGIINFLKLRGEKRDEKENNT